MVSACHDIIMVLLASMNLTSLLKSFVCARKSSRFQLHINGV